MRIGRVLKYLFVIKKRYTNRSCRAVGMGSFAIPLGASYSPNRIQQINKPNLTFRCIETMPFRKMHYVRPVPLVHAPRNLSSQSSQPFCRVLSQLFVAIFRNPSSRPVATFRRVLSQPFVAIFRNFFVAFCRNPLSQSSQLVAAFATLVAFCRNLFVAIFATLVATLATPHSCNPLPVLSLCLSPVPKDFDRSGLPFASAAQVCPFASVAQVYPFASTAPWFG